MKIVDKNIFITSLKCSWIKKIQNHINYGWIFVLPLKDNNSYRNYNIKQTDVLYSWSCYIKTGGLWAKSLTRRTIGMIKSVKWSHNTNTLDDVVRGLSQNSGDRTHKLKSVHWNFIRLLYFRQ